jgi:hypothetical protein
MDLVELRILAAGGILGIGIVLSALAVAVVTVAQKIGRARHVSAGPSVRAPVVGREPGLAAGRGARC